MEEPTAPKGPLYTKPILKGPHKGKTVKDPYRLRKGALKGSLQGNPKPLKKALEELLKGVTIRGFGFLKEPGKGTSKP